MGPYGRVSGPRYRLCEKRGVRPHERTSWALHDAGWGCQSALLNSVSSSSSPYDAIRPRWTLLEWRCHSHCLTNHHRDRKQILQRCEANRDGGDACLRSLSHFYPLGACCLCLR